MTWGVLIVMSILTLALKATGPLIFAKRPMPSWLEELVRLLPLAVYPALVASSVFSSPEGFTVDARLGASAIVLVILIIVRRQMFGAAMIIGAAVTAAIRAIFSG